MQSLELQKLLAGDIRSLARAITLIESQRPEDQEPAQDLLEKILPHTGRSMRLGITGSPGVGKSTFIENFGLLLIEQGFKVAVLAIDPSSPISGGSILGDKTRMEKLSQSERSFIRPTPAAGYLGGVGQKTRESILLCEAAGFDYVLVESLGVGQSEFELAGMVDFFLLMILPNSGDDLQGLKKGILELADAIIVNKADGDATSQAQRTSAMYQTAVEIMRHNAHWTPLVLQGSCFDKKKLHEISEVVQKYQTQSFQSGHLRSKRMLQNEAWFEKLILQLLQQKWDLDQQNRLVKEKLKTGIRNGTLMPLAAARIFLESAVPGPRLPLSP
jgi:LAO/AO transport system kinase